MEMLAPPLTNPALIFIVLFLVILFAPIAAERLRIPGIIGLLIAGMIVGPHVTGLIERDGMMEALGQAGLLYLMFLIGLDLDRDSLFEHRRGSLVFTAATFIIPMVVVSLAGVSLGMSVLGALIVASAFTSHTPITYPLVQRFGLVRNRAVIVTLGGTLLATVGALLVFAVLAASRDGAPGPWFWVQFALALAVFLILTLRGLPRLTKWFFAGLGQDRMVRFLFVIVVLFGMAALGEVTGIQAIVGAFLAGLGIERFVPSGSRLRERIDFLGDALFVPIFLVSTGMLIDPLSLILDPRILSLGLGLTVAAIGAKAVSAWVAALVLDYDRAELGVMISLSIAQAAGALAVVLVAVDLEMVQERALDAVILVILLSCIAGPLVASRYAPLVRRPDREAPALGRTVVVPVANPHSLGPLVDIAGLLAVPDGGEVIPVNVLGYEASRDQIDEHREATTRAEERALGQGADARGMVRIDSSPSDGVLHTLVENDATCLLLGWKGYTNARENLFGGVIDSILSRSQVPSVVCRPGRDDDLERIVLVLTTADLSPAGRLDLELSVEIARRISVELSVPLLVISATESEHVTAMLSGVDGVEIVLDSRRPTTVLPKVTQPGDVVIVGAPPLRAGLGQDAERVARAIPDRTVLVTVPR
jgi:Kef-type K+ transport system membrane component KefB/nucleotide-binding universal stress UspA family protein